MNNIYLNCIHCGYLKLTSDDMHRYARKGELSGITCKECNEEAKLLFLAFEGLNFGYTQLTFMEITTKKLRELLIARGL